MSSVLRVIRPGEEDRVLDMIYAGEWIYSSVGEGESNG
mgnify:CR=1 FL=1